MWSRRGVRHESQTRGTDGDCPEGIYFYVANVVYTDGQTSTARGTITLLR